MKNFKYLFYLLAVTVLSVSCENDGGTSVIPLNDGAVPNMTKSATTDAFFNLIRLNNGENVSVSFNAEVAQGTPASADIIGIYNTADGNTYSATLFSDVSLPQDFTISISDLVSAFAELSTSDDIKVGDALTLSARFTMADGTVLNILNDDGSSGTGANIRTTVLFTTVITYPVSCPSDLAGEYSAITNGDNTDGQPPAVDLAYDVTITDQGGGIYTISDFPAGAYILWYTVYGLTFEQEGTFTDVCGAISATFADAWGQDVPATGTVNENGTITLTWSNPWGDFATTILTKK
ncbi:hypothetical protein H7U19_13150 [Hyunsoonleella sp. SJ7]|uniref:Uncharacterized protein n=1 Tax=Hyunsoonleella aquatilis TaxID=2762758 RepID=A0A923HD92_9FLAO|nr:hypothetical protein [Hyunsoonleella aquatilis]MBC3759359.1 hypothetical protein [Hyunsoonleella aquatilis]